MASPIKGLANVADEHINPATEDAQVSLESIVATAAKQDDILVALDNLSITLDSGDTEGGLAIQSLQEDAIAELQDILTQLGFGAATAAASLPVTLASNGVFNTAFGTVGTAADPDGVIHGQLRSIADDVANTYTALGGATPHLYSASASESVAQLLYDGSTSAVDYLNTIDADTSNMATYLYSSGASESVAQLLWDGSTSAVDHLANISGYLYNGAASESVAQLLYDGTTSAVDHLATIAGKDFATENTLDDILDQLDMTTSGALSNGSTSHLYSSGGSESVADLVYNNFEGTQGHLYSSSGSESVADLLYSSSGSDGLADLIYTYFTQTSGHLYSSSGSASISDLIYTYYTQTSGHLYSSSLSTSIAEVNSDILEAVASGLPAYAADAVGADAYASVVTAPARQCHYLHVSVGDFGAIISLDGGSTDHFAVPANTERLFPGLKITSGADIKAKNLVGASNYTLLNISVW